MGFRRAAFDFYLGRARLCLGRETKIMGILNVTPDSFSDGGLFLDAGRAEDQALRMEAEGADLIDIGGESSRPGSKPVSAKEESRRIQPVLKRLARRIKIPISVDTYKEEVARMALDEGAVLINDIFALRRNKLMARLIARYKASVVLMHMRGDPETMQKNPRYRDLLGEAGATLKKAAHFALQEGISRHRILLDPGFGFGKTTGQNLELLRGLEKLRRLRFPVLVGLSRKSFLGNILGLGVNDRLHASLAAAAAAIYRGAHILRVHEVLAHKQVAAIIDKTMEGKREGGREKRE